MTQLLNKALALCPEAEYETFSGANAPFSLAHGGQVERAAQLGGRPIGAMIEDRGDDRLLAAGGPQRGGQWRIHAIACVRA
jgi:hypothetical protein